MLSCQRSHFEMPRDVCFMNAASYSPLLATSSVARVRKKKMIQVPDEVLGMLAPMRREIVRSAADSVVGELRRKFADGVTAERDARNDNSALMVVPKARN